MERRQNAYCTGEQNGCSLAPKGHLGGSHSPCLGPAKEQGQEHTVAFISCSPGVHGHLAGSCRVWAVK